MQRYTVSEIENNTFYQMPKFLFDEKFKGLSNDAKVLYSLLRDRHKLSIANNWFNNNGEVYMIYTRVNMGKMLGTTDKTASKYFTELKNFKLVDEEKHGQGNPNTIYLSHTNVENSKNGKVYVSRNSNIKHQEVKILPTNKTEFINNEILEEESIKMELDVEIINIYKDCISSNISNREVETLKGLQEAVGKELLNKAIVLATMKNGKNLGYIQAVLDDWEEKGLKTLDQVNIYLANWLIKNKKANENRTKQINKRAENKDYNYSKKKGNFNDYEQRTYDFGKLEKQLLGW
jgi:DnaD/phage-associated family protein